MRRRWSPLQSGQAGGDVAGTDRPHVVREAIQVCRKGGTVSLSSASTAAILDKFPFGAAFSKGLSFRMGQVHVHNYLRTLLEWIEGGIIDPSFVITHRLSLEDAPHGYEMFRKKQDQCIEVVLKP